MKATKKALMILCVLALPISLMTGCGASDAAEDSGGEVNLAPPRDSVVEHKPSDDSVIGEMDTAEGESFDAEVVPSDDFSTDDTIKEGAEEPTPGTEEDLPVPEIGEALVLTAGEWNDNENWSFFSNLVQSGQIAFPSYGLNPLGRIEVTLTADGAPANNQKVSLLDADGTALWQSVSDYNGLAYLFFDPSAEDTTYSIEVEGNSEIYEVTIEKPVDDQGGGQFISQSKVGLDVSTPSAVYDKTEVMFILDTTGSMSDEIAYLQKDFAAIVADTAVENISYSVNFYRDKGDEYVTKCNPFTNDSEAVQKLLNDEYATGGGDTPEAVAEILTETIENAQWSEDSNKIAFLIFDAPPHDDTNESIYRSIQVASEKGIHLVPVVASNADRGTELFGRALSILTNSNYVFLTDDSGVGNSHLEPIIGSYEVELLHDIIVRNIRQIANAGQE